MAAASSSSALSLAPLASLAVSDQELLDEGTHLSCLPELLRKFFGFVKVSLDRVRRAVRDQYTVGRLLPVHCFCCTACRGPGEFSLHDS
ncbi:hypothetical protein DFJ58DRAFT_793550 [Suillus subalutaceus]|uniref:uncharacterized protein n=1 Tax=Suillus subalutaceus TaxID=48586 RepID=UPI001B87DEAF|nr:uncharacterized protein DFJ58DRAFT_793550 [Suillus subalutaceus]KAG1850619.1 hypothetical protein DFJ58DRAFT_793550 [Suillus subalutaceus]